MPVPDLLLDLTPELLIAARSELGLAWRAQRTQDPFTRIYFIESGSGRISHHGRDFRLRPGYLYFIPAHTPLSYGTESRVVIQWLHCRLGPAGGPELSAFLPCRFETKPREPARIKDLFSRLIRLHPDNPAVTGTDWSLTLETRGLLLTLLAACAAPQPAARENLPALAQFRRFQPVLDRIERTLDPPPSMAELAALLHLTPAAFSRRFSALFGMPPLKYQLGRRIAAARELLREPDLKLDEIARRLGFSDAFHFSKTFKRLTGLSPRRFRQSPPPPSP